MKANKKKQHVPKYTVGPHGEIYNNHPVLSPKAEQIMNMMMFKEALDNVFNKDEEDIEDGSEGTPEANSEELHN